MRTEQLICVVALLGATAVFNIGCVAEARGSATASAEAEVDAPVVFVEPPTLVELDADVWVVRDYDYPVYYSGDYYFVYRDNVWYRSRYYDRGWAVIEVAAVPTVVVHRDHHAFVHFHGSANARTRVAARGYAGDSHRGSHERAAEEPHRGPPEHAARQHRGPPGQRHDDDGDRQGHDEKDDHRDHSKGEKKHEHKHKHDH